MRIQKLLNDQAANQRRAMARALMRGFMGPDPVREADALKLAAERLEDFANAIGNQAAAQPLRLLLQALYGYVKLRYRTHPDALTDAQLEALMRELCEPDAGPLGKLLAGAGKLSPIPLPSIRDVTRGLREMMTAAYYGTPATDAVTGYKPLWERKEALEIMPEIKRPTDRVNVAQVLEKQREGSDIAVSKLFANDGRPRVAIIGSGAGGAVAAATLAKTCDVAVFESGPSFTPAQYPLDPMAGMALLFRDGLMTFTQGYTVQMLLARLVGGGTVLTSGMSIRTRKSTLAAWQRLGLDLSAMQAALDSTEKRSRLAPLNEELVSDTGRMWRGQGVQENHELMFEVPLSNTVTTASQHDPNDAYVAQHKRGERCIACGLCNYGCRFGHKLSVEMTFVPDARARGARIHANLGVHRLVVERARNGETRVTGLILERDKNGPPIAVDHVVLAAGAVGSPQLLVRSMQHGEALQKLACAPHLGKHLGFNYGSTVVADMGKVPRKPGDAGIIIHYVASKPDDERFVLENAYLPPALMSSVVPGNGAAHREWMKGYKRLTMLAPTIGSPQTGVILPNGQVRYDFAQSEIDLIHHVLAESVRSYLRTGAARVALAGVRAYDESQNIFYASDDSRPGQLLDKIKRVAPTTDRLMMMSAHPQGGLIMGQSASDSAVSSSTFHVHGVANLAVADASLFPSTIVVNPQWTVMALAQVAADKIAEQIARRGANGPRTRAHEAAE